MTNVIKTTCCYCGVGCGLLAEVRDGHLSGVRGDPDHPANFGRLCTKGATLHQTALDVARTKYPVRRQRGMASGTRVTWAEALDEAAHRFADIIKTHGPDAVAFYISGQLMTEDYYVFNKLAKGLIGTNNVDTNSRLCMSSAVAGYKQTLGADAPPCSYEDIGLSKLILIAGANPALAHPIVYRRIEDAKAANPDLKIVVIDPRRTESAELADLHLPIRPGTDIALFNAVLHVLIAEELVDAEYIAQHTTGFAELAAIVRHDTPIRAAEICGVPAADIVKLARWFATSGASLSLYCQGLNQSSHGTHNNAALIHLHLATGMIGKPGAGPFSLTGQPNAMGGREVGGLANLLSAHRDLANPEHRAEVARLWGVPEVPAQPGLAAIDLFKALKAGTVKAVWIACTNPAHSLPDQALVREALATADYVVVQEAYAHTETVACADLLLPASGWGEKHGTVTNSERRITHVQPVVAPPGEARHDWEIVVDFAHRLGARLDKDARALFPYDTVESIFKEHAESTRGRDLDITGLSYDVLDTLGPQQWPFPEGAAVGTQRLYENGIFPTETGRARFVATRHQEVAEPTSAAYPISLMSGRSRDQWHGMSRTGTVPRLFNLEDEPLIYLHACDMRHQGITPGRLVRVYNERGACVVRAVEGSGLRKGRAWMPMHWGSHCLNSPGVNALTGSAVDPFSKQPELKHAAVAIEPAHLPWPLAIIRACASQEEALALRAAVRPLLADFPYANVALYGRSQPLVVFRASTVEPLSHDALLALDQRFGLDGERGAMRYLDASRGIDKKAVAENGRLLGVRLGGEVKAEKWLKKAMAEGDLDASMLRFALSARETAPVTMAARTIVCKCADISDRQIQDALASGASTLGALQDTLKCGTYCGGCIPDIKKMIVQVPVVGLQAA